MNRRSEKLDKYLNKRVEVTFFDGHSRTGVLKWNEHFEPLMMHPQHYYLRCPETDVCFRKSHVKSIKEVRE